MRARDLFFGLWVPDLFMKRIEADATWSLFCPREAPGLADCWGDAFDKLYLRYEAEGRTRKTIKARELWQAVLDCQTETGTPYMLFKDACNRKSNQQNLGTIRSSNLCVAGETMVLTDRGQFRIDSLVGQEVKVWNGDEWSKTTVRKTGESQPLYTVVLSSGQEICCTAYHKFIVCPESYKRPYPSVKDAQRVAAQDLKPETKLLKFALSEVPLKGDAQYDIKYPYTHGLFCADGTYSNDRPTIPLHKPKHMLLPHIEARFASGQETAQGVLNLCLPLDLAEKFAVPVNATLDNKLLWLAGYMDGDGTVARNGANESLQLPSVNKPFLQQIQLMLQTMGVLSKIQLAQDERDALLLDGHGGKQLYHCQPLWRLLIPSAETYRLQVLGLKTHRLKLHRTKPQRSAAAFVRVQEVRNEQRTGDTYCFSEPKNHAGVFNGQLTGQCTEVIEYTSPDEIAVCNLASVALPMFVVPSKGPGQPATFDHDKLFRIVQVMTRNLNKVIDLNDYPVPEARNSNLRHRPIGIGKPAARVVCVLTVAVCAGVQGLADTFVLMRYPFDSPEAQRLNKEIFETMYFAALTASKVIHIVMRC